MSGTKHQPALPALEEVGRAESKLLSAPVTQEGLKNGSIQEKVYGWIYMYFKLQPWMCLLESDNDAQILSPMHETVH